jgi:predicted DNA-binding transcriptional regulator YafY
MTAAELSLERETSLRNIYRDLQALEAAGFPVYTGKDGKQSYWKLMDEYHRDLRFPFTTTVLIGLHL